MNAKRLEEKDPGETLPLSWDFTDDLGENDDSPVMEITDVEITIAVDRSLRRNNDPTPTLVVNGSPQIEGNVVAQSVSGGIHGVDYKVTCKATINSNPESLLFKTSIVPVRNQ